MTKDNTVATVRSISLDKTSPQRIITVEITGKDSMYVEESKHHGFPTLLNSAPLIDGFNYVLEFGHHAVNAMKGNNEFISLVEENRELKQHILDSNLAARVRQFLSSIDYSALTDFQAKCALLLEKELK